MALTIEIIDDDTEITSTAIRVKNIQWTKNFIKCIHLDGTENTTKPPLNGMMIVLNKVLNNNHLIEKIIFKENK